MQCINMSYKGFSFEVNPSDVQLELSRHLSVTDIPFCPSRTRALSQRPSVIKGKGSFTGDRAAERAYELALLFKAEGAAYLFCPVFAPINAHFTYLKTSVNAMKSSVDFEFEFTEDCYSKNRSCAYSYTYARQGENLFDIANRTGVSVDDIVKINDFKDAFCISEGDRVWLR